MVLKVGDWVCMDTSQTVPGRRKRLPNLGVGKVVAVEGPRLRPEEVQVSWPNRFQSGFAVSALVKVADAGQLPPLVAPGRFRRIREIAGWVRWAAPAAGVVAAGVFLFTSGILDDPCESEYGPDWMQTSESFGSDYKVCKYLPTGLTAAHPDE